MTVTVKGEPLSVFFEYGTREVTTKNGTFEVPTTRCGIRRKVDGKPWEEWPILAEATVGCHHGDRFCKVEGRKIALARALGKGRKSVFTKLQRQRIWLSYLSTHRFAEGRGPLSRRELRSMESSLKRIRLEKAAKRATSDLLGGTLAEAGLVEAAAG